jgi:F-type H+-transporting ATPase subunit a
MPPTANLNTNGALALTVFAMTHIVGFKEHGISYLKHFMGPILVLAPLMFIIEVIGHLARPLSLSLRLFGNMYGHEIVLMIFFALVPFLLPVPMMLMGVLVACHSDLRFHPAGDDLHWRRPGRSALISPQAKLKSYTV